MGLLPDAAPLPLRSPVLQIGSVQLQSNLLLAPIAGYCDLAFRTICREFGGVGLACTDLLSPQGLLRGTAASLDLAQTNDSDRPVGMQLYGSDPAIMAEGARWAEDHGATIIDINMGCPVDKVTKKDGGSKLLCDPGRAVAIAERVAAAIKVPLTAKMRLGWSCADYESGVSPTLACRLTDVGIAAITVHGRTTEQRFGGEVNREGIRRVVQAVREHTRGRVPMIGNGDVREPDDAVTMIRQTGCQGVMIGRGALSTPWLFRDAWTLQTTGAIPEEPSEAEKVRTIRRYFHLMRECRDDHYAMHQIRQRISWFAKRLGSPAVSVKPLKEAIRLAPGPDAVESALAEFQAGGLRTTSHAGALEV
jgi:tRNA-dihydrouridine synthase B